MTWPAAPYGVSIGGAPWRTGGRSDRIPEEEVPEGVELKRTERATRNGWNQESEEGEKEASYLPSGHELKLESRGMGVEEDVVPLTRDEQRQVTEAVHTPVQQETPAEPKTASSTRQPIVMNSGLRSNCDSQSPHPRAATIAMDGVSFVEWLICISVVTHPKADHTMAISSHDFDLSLRVAWKNAELAPMITTANPSTMKRVSKLYFRDWCIALLPARMRPRADKALNGSAMNFDIA
eukprot:CAMPEP_0170187092 /NCGR_PEP_ID=MMETSP0040_2-20121228/40883_1 /TAXON_ID=641309 /ORGANISM="Lotharella oceanica, Strain CCMP622" /LENGTH=236 /DNA_ID=CAMNT_0010434031 /DNA_START=1403 /DNA_END=2115 /DNA_ORIENTATION=-